MLYLLDIEGTVCSISFVKDVLYPYALKRLSQEIRAQSWSSVKSTSPLNKYIADFPSDTQASPDALLDHVTELTNKDIKAPYWKALQGYLWKSGYESGEIKAPIYPDAIKFIKNPSNTIVIYSSGSIAAQKLIFGHVQGPEPDLNRYLKGYFDTTTAGAKVEKPSYDRIAAQLKSQGLVEAAEEITFVSDNVNELKAADGAQFHTVLAIRPGNAVVSDDDLKKYKHIETFDNL